MQCLLECIIVIDLRLNSLHRQNGKCANLQNEMIRCQVNRGLQF